MPFGLQTTRLGFGHRHGMNYLPDLVRLLVPIPAGRADFANPLLPKGVTSRG